MASCSRVLTVSERGRNLSSGSDSLRRMRVYFPWASLTSSQMPAQLLKREVSVERLMGIYAVS